MSAQPAQHGQPAPIEVPRLTDGVVTLRALHVSDVPRLVEQCVDPASVRWTTVPSPYSIDEAMGFVHGYAPTAWAQGTEWLFAIEFEGRFAGSLALRDRGAGIAEVGYGAHPDVRGTGAMERALRLVLEWGFTEKQLRAVQWAAVVGNWASRRLAWKVGFSCDGILRGTHPHRGEAVDAWVGSLLRDEPREPREPWAGPTSA